MLIHHESLAVRRANEITICININKSEHKTEELLPYIFISLNEKNKTIHIRKNGINAWWCAWHWVFSLSPRLLLLLLVRVSMGPNVEQLVLLLLGYLAISIFPPGGGGSLFGNPIFPFPVPIFFSFNSIVEQTINLVWGLSPHVVDPPRSTKQCAPHYEKSF